MITLLLAAFAEPTPELPTPSTPSEQATPAPSTPSEHAEPAPSTPSEHAEPVSPVPAPPEARDPSEPHGTEPSAGSEPSGGPSTGPSGGADAHAPPATPHGASPAPRPAPPTDDDPAHEAPAHPSARETPAHPPAHDGQHEVAPEPEPRPYGTFFGLFPESSQPDVVVVPNAQPGLLDAILPRPPDRGLRSALPLGALAALLGLVATGLRYASRRLRPNGVLPQILRVLEILLRLGIALAILGALGAMVPASMAPAVPVVIIALAVAVGWSARDVLQDLVAGVFLGVEGQLRAGHWVRGDRYSGTVEAIGLRVTWLRDVHGRRIVVPNRVLLAQPLVADDNPWPRIQFTVAMPDAPAKAIRSALEEAIVLSPWVAPHPDAEIHPDGITHHHWKVAVRLLDSRYADRFQGLLRERVEDILGSARTERRLARPSEPPGGSPER